mgnify:CR=1 FL=1
MSDMVGGIYPKVKSERSPDFVICKMSINVDQFREWMQGYIKANPNEEWINMDFLVSRAGKGYAKIDDWKPDNERQSTPIPEIADEDIPF